MLFRSILAWVFEAVPVSHFDGAACRVVQLVLWVPNWAIVEVGVRLHVERGFLITRSRFVCTQPAGHVRERVSQLFDIRRFDVDLHNVFSFLSLVFIR